MRFWTAVTEEENGRYCSYVMPFTEYDNVLFVLRGDKLKHANVFSTKKRACEVANYWNECYKQNGTYMFDTPDSPLF